MTIYTATPAAWIKQGNRLVKTWPSGLCLIQQDYIGPTKLADYDQFKRGDAIEGASPCIDGAVIFPDPEYQDLGDGFTRCTVSAYGRTNISGNKTLTKTISEHTAQWQRITGDESDPLAGLNTRLIPTISDQLVWTFVVPKTAAPNVTATDSLNIYRLNGQSLSPLLLAEFFNVFGHRTEGSVQQITKPVLIEITRAECVNFGAFDEWTVVYNSKVENSLFNFGTFLIISAPESEDKEYDFELGPPNTIPGHQIFNWDSNNSASVQINKVWNLNAPNGMWNSTTPRQEMLDNANNTTYLGGTLRRNVITPGQSSTLYIAPQPNLPESITLPPDEPDPGPYTSAGITWNPELVYVSDGQVLPIGYKTYKFVLQHNPLEEVFEVELKNELNQTSKYNIVIRFTEPE